MNTDNILEIEMSEEHIQGIVSRAKPFKAISELIWNCLDADANEVHVNFKKNELGGTTEIYIKDNGHGININDINSCFKFLGSSLKRSREKSPRDRIYHGRNGEGRYLAFSLGHTIQWKSVFEVEGKNYEFTITGDSSSGSSLKNFHYTNAELTQKSTGVEVGIFDIKTDALEELGALNQIKNEIITTFAHYIRAYQRDNIKLFFDEKEINISDALLDVDTNSFKVLNEETGEEEQFKLDLYHWRDKGIKKRYFCSQDGVVIYEDNTTGITAKDFGHSIYISGELFDKKNRENTFQLLFAHPIYKLIEDKIYFYLTEFLQKQLADRAKAELDSIKKTDAYPFKGEPKNNIEKAEREIFDIYASKVITSPKNILGKTKESKAFTLQLLKTAVERDPEDVNNVIKEVLKLPSEEVSTLNELIKQHSLSTVIKISKLVSDRMVFLDELQHLLFNKDAKKEVLERQHLHKILERELWIFGDGYQLGTSDKRFEDVLREHLTILGRTDFNVLDEAVNSPERPDFFLYKQFPQSSTNKFHHLIVEIKRPSCKLTETELSQIKRYALKVSQDSRFDKKNVEWTFVLMGDDLDDLVFSEINQSGRPSGCALQPSDGNFSVYVHRWADKIDGLSWKYSFIRQKLDEFNRTPEDLNYIRTNFGYLFEGDKKKIIDPIEDF